MNCGGGIKVAAKVRTLGRASVFFTLYLTSAVMVIGAPSLRAETLTDALVDAYSTNPGLQAQRARLRVIDERVPQALSNWRPTVTINTKAGVEHEDKVSAKGVKSEANGEPRSADLTVSQPLFRGFRTQRQTERAKHQVAAQRARLLANEQTILLNAVTAYMDVVQERAVLELSLNNIQVLDRQLEAARDRFEVGELTRTDVAQAESRLQSAVANRVDAEGALTYADAIYVNVTGHEPGNLEFPASPTGLPNSEDTVVNLARLNSPEVISADFDVQAAQADVLVVRGELYPTLSLNGTISHNENGAVATETTERSVTANLKIPLYQSGSVYSRLREAQQTVSQRQSDMIGAQRDAVQQAKHAWESLATARASKGAFEAAVMAQEIALEGTRQEARVGARTVLDVLDAELELLDTRVNLVRAERDEIVASFVLLSAMGRLTAEDLTLPVEYYDFSANYEQVRGRWLGAN